MIRGLRRMVLLGCLAFAPAALAQRPTPDQARAMLQSRPDLGAKVRDYIANSGLTPEQIRARLLAAGYPSSLLDQYLGASDSVSPGAPDRRMLSALRSLGITGPEDELLFAADTVRGNPGGPRTDLPERRKSDGLQVFGLDVFERVGTQFQPAAAGPVDPSYRLGPGDVLVLILTGDVELAHTLEVTREGFIVIPQVGQVYVSGLNMAQLDNLLYQRLGRVYSGVHRGDGATTRFQVSVARLRTNQVFVIGDVVKPGSYQVSSAGTVLTALYLAGGPRATGSFRRVEVRRGGRMADSLDIYDYLLRGNNSHDIRLETGDVVFVPVHGIQAEIAGAITRPAIYELKPGETLRDLIAMAGGFEPFALRRRVQIDRIVPPPQRQGSGRDRVVLDIAENQFTDEIGPALPVVAGDRVKVFAVDERRRNVVTVHGNVWTPGQVGFKPGMKLSEAIRLAGGPKPDVFIGQILISRLNPDSTRNQLRSSFRDSTGAVVSDIPLQEDDAVEVFSRTTFRPIRYVAITGAVRSPHRLPYRDGMTLRDAVLGADGLTEDALLNQAEIARLPDERVSGALAVTIRVTLDSSYIFDRGPNGEYKGPPGLPAAASGAPEIVLKPYDNVLILRQPEWEQQRTVTIVGRVMYPGVYSLRTRSERITDLITRVGGLTRDAYPRGAELYRPIPYDSGSTFRLVSRLRLQVKGDSAQGAAEDTVAALAKRRGVPAIAERVGLDLPRALARPSGLEDLILHAGDSIWIPEYDPTVRVVGAVNAPTTVVHRPGWNLNDYVAAAGGFNRIADKRRSWVVQPGGQVESVKRRFLLADGKPTPLPGAVVFVPERDPADKKDFVGLFGSIAQILASTLAIIVVATRL